MTDRFTRRRQWRWHETILQFHCPTCHQIAGQPCDMNPVPPTYRDYHLTRADMARRARKG